MKLSGTHLYFFLLSAILVVTSFKKLRDFFFFFITSNMKERERQMRVGWFWPLISRQHWHCL